MPIGSRDAKITVAAFAQPSRLLTEKEKLGWLDSLTSLLSRVAPGYGPGPLTLICLAPRTRQGHAPSVIRAQGAQTLTL